ncbi:GATA transcription factor 5-like isoform X2 [Macadamia integrifolia]|nr:GATA transcription factor 5-like isoform X2 [Macadamia integrifolia]XP_042500497.1 GATA transcription factor 5-like isoform X2 [Macadamia integrifolia]
MDCVEARALKGSFRPECMAAFMKSSQQPFLDDVWFVNVPNGVSGDDLFVDELLDFSNDDVEEGPAQEQEAEKRCASVSSQEEQPFQDNSNATSFSISELSVPADDLADLEWLSHFVEDSFSEFSVAYPSSSSLMEKTENGNQTRPTPETVTETVKTPCFPAPVPCKARSKRSRTGGRVWSLGSLSFTESSCTSSSSISSTTTSSSSSSTSPFVFVESGHNIDMFYYLGKPPAKKQKKKKNKLVAEAGGSRQEEEDEDGEPRKCSHCHVQKTPQWRTGPLGAKTLCNACGVRYKSGRLLPEYRPACSPTFSSDVHSNNHRKVLEMRRKKEIDSPEPDVAPAVQSF